MKSYLKTTLSLSITLITLLSLSNYVNAQLDVLEKSFEIDKKARKGDLRAVSTNEENGTIELVYTKAKAFSNNIQSEIYTYSKDLEFVKKEEKEIKMRMIMGKRTREDESYTTITCTPKVGFPVKPVFKQQEVKRSFDWLSMRYRTTSKLVDKVMPESGSGTAYNWSATYDMHAEKAVLVLAGKHKKKTSELLMKHDIMRGDVDGKITVTDHIDFDRPYLYIYSGPLLDDKEEDEYELTRDWILVMAPSYIKPKYFPAVDPRGLVYYRISPQGKIIEKLNFQSPSNRWEISSAVQHDGSVYLVGAAVTKDAETLYHSQLYNSKGATYTHMQLAKITDGKLDFVTSVSADDINGKQSMPSSQKKAIEFDGKQLIVNDLVFDNNGDYLIQCQDGVEKRFEGNYLFRFDKVGAFKNYHNVQILRDGKVIKEGEKANAWKEPTRNYYYSSADGKSTYWLMASTKEVFCETVDASSTTGATGMSAGVTMTYCSAAMGVDVVGINNETGEMSELVTTGHADKKKFHLYSLSEDVQQMGNYLFMVSRTEKGKQMMLSRVDISK